MIKFNHVDINTEIIYGHCLYGLAARRKAGVFFWHIGFCLPQDTPDIFRTGQPMLNRIPLTTER